MPYPPELHVQRFLSGSSHGWGGLHTEISNSHSSKNLRLIYLDMIPWFCRIFIHTLHISNGMMCAVIKWCVLLAEECILVCALEVSLGVLCILVFALMYCPPGVSRMVLCVPLLSHQLPSGLGIRT